MHVIQNHYYSVKKVSTLLVGMPIQKLWHNTVETTRPNKGKPAVMLGRKASGPGVGQDSGVTR
jgi:hypothetical protein